MAARLPDLYANLRNAARHQLDALAAHDVEAFSTASDVRDQVFRQIQANDGELARLSPDDAATIRALIAEILKDDMAIEAGATQLSAQAQEELRLIQQGLSALSSYAVGDDPTAYFIDRDG